MRKVTGSRLLWIASAGSLALAAAVGGCSSKSSGNNTTTNEDGGEEDGGSSSSSGAGSSSSSSGAASSSSSSGGVAEASVAEASTEAGSTEAGTSTDAGCTTLNVYNFKDWCTVSVNGTALSFPPNSAATGGTASVCVAPGAVALVASPESATFELGADPWVYISGTGGTDSGIPGTIVGEGGVGSTSTTTVNVGSTPGCVLVCCPFSSDGSGCNSAFSGYSGDGGFTSNCP
jgi:hypothetical protein